MLAAALLVEMAISTGKHNAGMYMHDIDDDCMETNKMQWQATWSWAFEPSCQRQQGAVGMLFIPRLVPIYQRGDDTIFA